MWTWLFFILIALFGLALVLNLLIKGFFLALMMIFYVLGVVCFVSGFIVKILRLTPEIFEFAFALFKVGNEMMECLDYASGNQGYGYFQQLIQKEIRKQQKIAYEDQEELELKMKEKLFEEKRKNYQKRL